MWQCTFFPAQSRSLFSLVFGGCLSPRPPNTREKRRLLTGDVLFFFFYIPVSKDSFYFRSLHREYKTKTWNSNHGISRSKMNGCTLSLFTTHYMHRTQNVCITGTTEKYYMGGCSRHRLKLKNENTIILNYTTWNYYTYISAHIMTRKMEHTWVVT